MGDLMDDDVIPLVRKYALQNALEYDGKGQVGSTLGRLLSERQDLRPKAKDLMSLVSKEVVDANKSMNENGADHVRREIENIDPSAVNRVRQEKNAGLKPLEIIPRGEWYSGLHLIRMGPCLWDIPEV